mmetsp:Transcript_114307/g.277554  ORF Transcript_114307/g.277554 Transcript_114307/m.277554 type:complete len:85 (+) Transcript_114307:286-540(+)
MNCFHENAFILENISFALQIHFVIRVLIYLLCLTVLFQESAENTVTAKPKNLGRQASLASTSALAISGMPPEPLSCKTSKCTSP